MRTNEKHEALGWGIEARSDRVQAMNNGGLEVDIEDTEHVNSVKNDTKNHKPCLSPLQPFASSCAGAGYSCSASLYVPVA